MSVERQTVADVVGDGTSEWGKAISPVGVVATAFTSDPGCVFTALPVARTQVLLSDDCQA